MAQGIWNTINPYTTSGLMLAGLLDDFKDAYVSGFSGTTRPPNLQEGGVWVDTTNQAAPDYYWSFKIYNGSTDLEVFRISILYGYGGVPFAGSPFEILKVSADANGPLLNFIKERVADNGQLLTGDVIGEIRLSGHTNTDTDIVVGSIRATVDEDMTTTDAGVSLSVYATPDGTANLIEHIRCLEGSFETIVPWKLNALRPVSQNVATTATIAALNADKFLVEMTGATPTDIQGISATDDSKVVTIHNRSSAAVTLKHENLTASANNRIKLVGSLDHEIPAEGSAQLFYCEADTRWKVRSAGSPRNSGRSLTSVRGLLTSWTAPSNVTMVRVSAYRDRHSGTLMPRDNGGAYIDAFGNRWGWGVNTNAQIGDNTQTTRSSPVLISGNLKFQHLKHCRGMGQFALDSLGRVYAWGLNSGGQLGVGDANARSTPTAVTGGLKFTHVAGTSNSNGTQTTFNALTTSGEIYGWGGDGVATGAGATGTITAPTITSSLLRFETLVGSANGGLALDSSGAVYAWGYNSNGQLGVGDVTHRSSPVAVLGGLSFNKVEICSASQPCAFGLTAAGALYAWGDNTDGQLGVGDVTPRSSPVAVLGGLVFKEFFVNQEHTNTTILGMTAAGALYAWGDNTDGQLGVGDVTPRSSPVAVLGGLTFKHAVVGFNFCMALTQDGTLYAWGNNTDGQLGDGTVVAKSSPVAVIGGLKFSAASAPTLTECAYGVTGNGTVYSWGRGDANWGLGQGAFASTSSPVVVFGGNAVAPMTPLFETYVPVTPGQSYTIVLSNRSSRFGSVPIGTNVDEITIEYDN